MKLHHLLFTGLTSLAASSIFADAAVEVGAWTQDAESSRVTIAYTLTGDDSRIITFDVLTNGVSIGTDNLSHAIGDVYKIVEPGASTRKILWRPDLSWEGHVFTKGEISVKVIAWPKSDPPDYMVVNLAMTNSAPNDASNAPHRYYPSAGAVPGGVGADVYRGENLLMRRIHAAGKSFVMGTPLGESFHVSTLDKRTYDQWVVKSSSDSSRDPDKSVRALPETQHEVGFTKDFYIGVFPLTHLQMNLIEATWSPYSSDKYLHWKAAACYLSWNSLRGAGTWPGSEPAATSTLGKLRARTGIAFDMPTEAQWEYACRAGTTTSLNTGKEISSSQYAQTASGDNINTREVAWAWCYSSAEKKAASMTGTNEALIPVGLLKPNVWGLYDMHGLVCEWCLDWVDGEPLADAIDPIGLESSSLGAYGAKAQRGGSSEYWSLQARSGCRMGLYPDNSSAFSGCRVTCPIVVER